MNDSILLALANHLWQSTLFAAAVGVLTLLLRNNSARIRYSLWLIASAKFLVPFSLLTAFGAEISRFLVPAHVTQTPIIAMAAEKAVQITSIGTESSMLSDQASGYAGSAGLSTLFIALWAVGALAIATSWFSRWMQIRHALRQSTASELSFVIPVRLSAAQLEPGLVGIVHPVLLLPEGIDKRLTAEQMRAVLAHEHCHLVWRDNLAGALHMLVEVLFWFNPLVWWIGKKLVDERERACDEYVIANGHARDSYAEGILNVCEQYLKLQLPCVSGMSGAQLRQRMEDIMQMQLIERLSGVRKILLSMAAVITVAAPIAVGVFTAPSVSAQATQGAEQFFYKNVSIRLAPAEQGNRMKFLFSPNGLEIENLPLRTVIANAYDVNEEQVVGWDWSKEPRYSITAITDAPAPAQPTGGAPLVSPNVRNGAALQELLATHFGLVTRVDKKPLEGYALLLGTGESKLTVNATDAKQRSIQGTPGLLKVTNMPLSEVAKFFSKRLGAPVTDQTGLKGNFDFEIAWEFSPDTRPDPAAIAKTLEQLGLKLEAKSMTGSVVNVLNLKSSEEVVNNLPVNTLPTPPAPNLPGPRKVQELDLGSQTPLTNAQIVGVYEAGVPINVVEVDGKLYMRGPQAADRQLIPAGLNSYKPADKPGVITFYEKDGSLHLLFDVEGDKFVYDKRAS